MFCLNEYFVTLIENAKYLHHHLFPSIAICIPYTTHRLLKQNEHLKLKVVERKSKGMDKAEFMLLYSTLKQKKPYFHVWVKTLTLTKYIVGLFP